MFTIYRKNVGGRILDRYFRSWDKAKELLESELSELREDGWPVIFHQDKMNVDKGFYWYYYNLKTPDGEDASLSLIDGYFED